MIFVINFTSRN